ncbi:methyl-CpG-binding domain-containing protein 2-like isoform X1 [Pistacia vera]|uniref:methyl-CpG-binding domain-containing protein 2-like isoform X1 n=2 Tax=Pistacia vera TaxID=55513 RepID=UPI001263C04D|nr:methyl-CpG-binding domain-containing protein 2-like isoform X1 [Pistacia vera]
MFSGTHHMLSRNIGWLRSVQMQSDPGKASVRVEKDENDLIDSNLASNQDNTHQEQIDLSTSTSSSSSSDDESIETQDLTNGNASKQLVLYDPTVNGTGEIVPVPEPAQCQRLPFGRYSGPNMQSRVLPSVGAFTVQCANCFKWRLIPTKEKYEEIREHVLENPFICEKAREWRPDISCNDPTDISQDGSRLWAIDKPNIAQPPPGWQRLLRIRGEGSTKFADVYVSIPICLFINLYFLIVNNMLVMWLSSCHLIYIPFCFSLLIIWYENFCFL